MLPTCKAWLTKQVFSAEVSEGSCSFPFPNNSVLESGGGAEHRGGEWSAGRARAGGQRPSAKEDIPRGVLGCPSLFRGRRDSSEGGEVAAWHVGYGKVRSVRVCAYACACACGGSSVSTVVSTASAHVLDSKCHFP